METKQQMDERIDRYLSGQMTGNEKAHFESQMTSDPLLQEEVDLHARIVKSIKAKNAKKLLQEREKNIRHARHRKKILVRTLSGFAAAACIAFGVIHFQGVVAYQSYGERSYATIDISASRGGSQTDSLLQVAYKQIGRGDYIQSHESLDEAIALLQKEQFNLSTEEGQYLHQLNRQQIDDARWLKAISYMKQGKRHRAKIVLKEIAAGEGIYKTQAQKILNQ